MRQRSLKKGILNLMYKQGLLFEKSKKPDKFRASKTHKGIKKVSKTQRGNKFEIVLMMQKYAKIILTFGWDKVFVWKMLQKKFVEKLVVKVFIKSFEAEFFVIL